MKVIISPAKKLNQFEYAPHENFTQPIFIEHATKLIDTAKKLTFNELKTLFKISDNLINLNIQRYKDFNPNQTLSNARQAGFVFAGDTYTGLNYEKLSEGEITISQEKLLILSGLYGILRPLDLIQEYRLEMGIKFKHDGCKDLYEFWSEKITNFLNNEHEKENFILINCASNEYFNVIDTCKLKPKIITPIFKQVKDGQTKIISFNAKKARGAFANYIIKNNINDPEKLKKFDLLGYQYQNELSNENELIFYNYK